jgi:hypothetical protein
MIDQKYSVRFNDNNNKEKQKKQKLTESRLNWNDATLTCQKKLGFLGCMQFDHDIAVFSIQFIITLHDQKYSVRFNDNNNKEKQKKQKLTESRLNWNA